MPVLLSLLVLALFAATATALIVVVLALRDAKQIAGGDYMDELSVATTDLTANEKFLGRRVSCSAAMEIPVGGRAARRVHRYVQVATRSPVSWLSGHNCLSGRNPI